MSKIKASDTFTEPPSAVLAPSSITHRTTAPQAHVRHRELEPAPDTGKDTQQLVEEDC